MIYKDIEKTRSIQLKGLSITSLSSTTDFQIESLLHFPSCYKLSSLLMDDGILLTTVYQTMSTFSCPSCGCPSQRTRGSYYRTLLDIPVVDRCLVVQVRVRRFHCENPDCTQKYFSEPLSGLATRYSRKTTRCNDLVVCFSKEMSSVKASGLLSKLGIHVSPSTCVRELLKCPVVSDESLKEVGIDDFANKKGHIYYSVIVDHQTHRPVDVLHSRESSEVTRWFSQHSTIETVTRDRGTCFISGLESHPRITQISDRFHLIKNLTDPLTAFIYPEFIKYRENYYQSQIKLQQFEHPGLKELMTELSDRIDHLCTGRNRRKIEIWKKIYQMELKGYSISDIAKKTGLKSTKVLEIKKNTKEAYYTNKQKSIKKSLKGIAQAVLRTYEHKAINVYKELSKSQKRNISKRTLQDVLFPILEKYRQKEKTIKAQKKKLKEVSLREEKTELFKCFLFKGYQIKNRVVEAFIENWKLIDCFELIHLCREFRNIIMKGENAYTLDNWIRMAENSECKWMETFAKGIRKEYKSVYQAYKSTLSNGVLEGVVNKIKCIKRQMYGKASFQLLRAKTILAQYG